MDPKHQFSLELIEHTVEQSVVQQRKSDGYINATALCNAAGRRWYNFHRTESTGHFLRALEAKTQIRVLGGLIQEVREGTADGVPSTWVHPQVAVYLAQWLSAEFAVQVSEWVHQWLSGGGPRQPTRLPPHIERHMLNFGKVPPTHFSILQEMTTMLIAPLEAQGYTLPAKFVPDISQGKMFCKFLRDNLGVDTDALPTYEHEYPDGRKMPAKLYPIEVLTAFRKYINDVWLPERSAGYFSERDPDALLALDKVLKITYQAPTARAKPALPKPARRKTVAS
jgi:KilA-N domain